MTQNFLLVCDFVLLFLISFYVRQRYLRGLYSPTTAATVIMAFAVFTLYVLPYFPFSFIKIRPILTLELLIIWLFIAESYFNCYLQKHFYIHLKHLSNRVYFGSWATATVFLSLLWFTVFPNLDVVVILLGCIALALWIEYMRLMIGDIKTIARNISNAKVSGAIFLLTISIQSIAILVGSILTDKFPVAIFILLIILGYFYFAWCLLLITRYYFNTQFKYIINDWAHSNSLIHASLSISGIACLQTLVVSNVIVNVTWMFAFLFLVIVEGIALTRFSLNIRKKGLKAAILKHDFSQWLRSFSYGIFYAFSIKVIPIQPNVLKPITFFIIQYGNYFILGFLLIEATLFFHAKYKPKILESVTSRSFH